MSKMFAVLLPFYISQKTCIFQSHNLFPSHVYMIGACLEENCSVKCSNSHNDLLVVQLLRCCGFV